MKPIYETKFDKMIENSDTMRKSFKWQEPMLCHLASLTFAMKDKSLDVDAIKDMNDYIKANTGAFSAYRGTTQFALSTLLCASSDNPKEQFNSMLKNEAIIKSVGFKNETCQPIALYTLTSVYDGEDIQGYCDKAASIYKEMKSNHPFLTDGNDYALAILLANTDKDISLLEEYYKALNEKGFSKSNGLQMLSHILSLGNLDVFEAVDRCSRIYDKLKAAKLKVSSNFYSTIGLIALLDENQDELITDLIEITNQLKKQKGYKFLDKGMNIFIASSLITSQYVNDKSSNTMVETALSVSITAIIAAQQAAMIASLAATSVAVSTAVN